MAEDLSLLLENFSITEEEDAEVTIPIGEFQEVVSYGKNCVVPKLVADRLISMEVIKATLRRWWKLHGKMSFKALGDNLFLIEFTNSQDKERTLEGRPWVFEGSLFLVEDFDGITSPSDYTFDKDAFWVRMFKMPLGCMGQAIGRRIGETVGTVEVVDTNANGMGWGKFLRAKILMDLTKPLPRGRKINIQGKLVWIPFQYERLPKFCYSCGIISHDKRGCPQKSSLRQQDPQYGPWL
ncbi:uncharacterized protein LOC132182043 [Corylus avellana]|uniref:uncharacterized protein LOC132182043 n=1 Tax=Corylus avellana TaxID=13451 RepID=UPI00286CBD84|nr:uncharacterized protein LOC132182043 [Corylus avellana]